MSADPFAPTFLLVRCDCDERPRLGARALCEQEVVWTCQGCAKVIDLALAEHEWCLAHDLDALGYDLEGHTPTPKHGEQGCRDGQCGVRQPH